MKQTNNAIKFLMAQYRAIFKNAYFKGMATALVLTAGLAAGQAQATASADDPWYKIVVTDGQVTNVTKPMTEYKDKLGSSGDVVGAAEGDNVAGGLEDSGSFATDGHLDGVISGADLTVGNSGANTPSDVKQVSGSVYGAYLNFTGTNNSSILAEDINLHLIDGAVVSGGAVGAYVSITNGQATANGVTTEIGSGTISVSGTSAGARVYAPNGSATATDNHLIVKEGANLTLNDTGWLAGATATGLQATVTGNSVEIQNSANAKTTISGSKLGLVTGGIAYNMDENKADSFRVISNSLTATNTTISTADNIQVTGGLALIASGTVAGGFHAEGNTVDLTGVTISSTGDKKNVQVVGNMVDVTKKDTATNRNVFANGVDGVLSLNIVNGTITGQDSDSGSSTITKGLIAGGYATTDAGSATANQNAVVITNTAITDAGVYGGAAVASGADVTAQASYNSLTLTDLKLTDSVRIAEASKNKDKTALNIAGGYVKVSDTILAQQRIDANNNIVTLQAGREENSASTVTGNVYGVLVDVGTQKDDAAGATINASNNKVVIGEKTTVTGNVYGAWSKENATMTGNSVEINGRVIATTQSGDSGLVSPVIVAAYAGKGNDKNLSVLTGNSITIGETAEINGVDLYAVAVDPEASGSVTVTGNKVTVSGKVTDSTITGGQGADSVINLTANSLYTVSASSTGETLASDKIELNGNIINRSDLTLRGYESDGNNSGDTYNSNLTNLNAGAALYNADTVAVVGSLKVDDGATIMAINPGATISVTGSDTYKPTDADKKAKAHQVGDWGVLTLSQQQLTNYLTADDAHTVVNLPNDTIAYDYAGRVTITNGGTLEFTDDAVVLSDFDYTNTATDGKITVDSTPDNGGSILKGNNVTVAHKFASNATTAQAYKDLNPINAAGIKIKANTLNLGSSTLTSAQSAEIKFDDATARDAINFNAMTTGTGNYGYVLTSDVIADRKFFDQQIVDKAEINSTTLNSNGNGTITGKVTISGGSLSVNGGSWTSDSNITIDSGSLSVGASGAGTDANGYYVNNGNPASLTLTGVLDISGDSTTPNANVTVTGRAGADATLDLTGADVKWGAGTVTVSGNQTISYEQFNTDEAKDYYADNSLNGQVGYGKLLLNREDFNEFLNDKVHTPAQTKLNIGNNGYVHVNGSVTGSYDFDKFGTAEAAGVVAFTGAGTLDIDGELNVVEAAEGADNTFDIGHGTIKANIISINTEDKDRDENPEAITLAGGTLEVEQGFSTNSSEFTIAGNDEHDAALILAAGLEHTGSLTIGGTSGLLTVGNNAKLTVQNGTWSNDKIDLQVTGDNVQGAAVVVGPYDNVLIKQAQDLSTDDNTVYVASLQADNFAGEGSGTVLYVGEQSSATFNTMQLTGDAVVNVDGYLKVEGRNDINDRNDPAYVNAVDGVSSTAGINFEQGATITVDGVGSTFELGETATQALVTIDSTVTDVTKNKYLVDEVLSDANIVVSNFGELKINLSADQTLTKADAAYLTTTLLGSNNYNGYLNVGAADLGITFTPDANGNNTVAWDDIEDFANITAGGTTSQDLKYALVTGIDSANDRIQGHYGALQVTTGNTSALQVVGPLSLHNAAAFGGKFVFRGDYLNGTTTAADVVFAQNASLALENGGEIGSITGYGSYDEDYGVNSVQISAENGATTTVNGSITKVDELIVNGATTVSDSIAVNFLDLASSLNTTAEKGSVHVNDAAIAEGATLTTNAFTIGNANGYRGHDNLVHVMGTITTGDLTMNENAELELFGGSVSAKNLTASATSDISVGYEPLSTIVEDDPDTIYDDTKAYTGFLEITGQTKLNGAELYVDPEYGDRTALVSLNKLSNWTNASPRFEGGVLDGSVLVGRNSALGIGSDSLATLQSKIARFQNGVSLEDPQSNPDGVGAVLYLGNSFTLGAGESLWLTALTSEGVREYYNANNGTLADISSTANLNVLADTVYLGENTAIVVDAGVLENSSAMITLAGTNGNASVIADGGDIYIDGNVRASTYQVFSGAQIKYIDGTDYAVTEDSEKNINVSTINDFLQGVVDEQGKVTLGVAHNGRAIMHGASDPVYESLLAYVRGYNGPEVKQEVEETPSEEAPAATNEPIAETPVTDLGIQGVEDSRELYSYNDKGEKVYGQYSNYLLQETIATGDGSAAETVARLAVFGGAAQAAISAGASTYDAVSGRMGVGANGANITVADNTQGAALWLAPIYKSSDSDGFDAEGVDYGVDMDLYGVALGADYTLSNGIRFGAMFNVGSGEVDGQGAGSAVSNDFDYYGFAVYGGYSMGALSVVADVSYTVADNDLEGNTSIDKVGASLDSTNLSFGVTGQYQLDFNGATVTPHAGLRFSRIDLDDYTIDGEDVIADYDADSMNIFSIPVGVTFAKEFTGDAWTIKPSLDLTLTGNFGDDETDGTVHWAGVENLSTNVSSEVIDNFTYGATLGVAAKTGNFSLGLGVNYTGSSNVDEFGVNANARFVF